MISLSSRFPWQLAHIRDSSCGFRHETELRSPYSLCDERDMPNQIDSAYGLRPHHYSHVPSGAICSHQEPNCAVLHYLGAVCEISAVVLGQC
ncbi:hypothetical protein A0H81_08028 [Grifola frondosa]|uniref:Uncharacterized protein n=1 Tax=Grifola frondosa TaxID=5627 RepID=A0A1C7MBR1_GRIFR|nr:hypothetical protein A0H81_08028 [Grifola frondosa]